MSDETLVEAAIGHFARLNLSLNAKVIAVEYDQTHDVWLGTVLGSTGTHRLVARRQADGTWMISRYLGSLPRTGDR